MTGQELGFWEGIADVASGRGQLRLVLQPLVAIMLGIRFGIADAKEHKGPFLLRLFRTDKNRVELARQAAMDVIVPFSIAVVLDGILQYLSLGYVRPAAAVVMGIVLIWVPFAVSRALTNRIYSHSHPAVPTT
ncbi:MAG: hypothetical protein JWP01_2840 [Myxococcales bacterium]|nr:hypothetical protein [Myxococcales bacterium]